MISNREAVGDVAMYSQYVVHKFHSKFQISDESQVDHCYCMVPVGGSASEYEVSLVIEKEVIHDD